MIASGYEDGNDATTMRSDPAFKLAQDVLLSGPDLASQPTLSRLENWPDLRALLRMGKALINLYCASYARFPKRIVLDFDDTFEPCMAASNCVCSTPITTNTASSHRRIDGDGRSSRNAAPGQASQRRGNIQAPSASAPGDPGQLAGHAHSHSRRQPYCCPEVIDFAGQMASTSSSASPLPQRCAAMSKRSGRATSVFRGRAEEGQDTPFQGVLRNRRESKPCRTHHCAGRSG